MTELSNLTIIDQIRPDHPIVRKRKALLVTLYGNYNYGNVLQRYALTRTLETYSFEVTHLCHDDTLSLSIRLKIAAKLQVKYILALLGVKKFRLQLQQRKADIPRTERFKAWQDAFAPVKIFSSFRQALTAQKSQWNAYAFAITGSDQVWHGWSGNPDELAYYYLEFMPREKRLNYAPSFGFTEFSPESIELHRKGLSGFDQVSCREQEMQPMIHALTRQEAELVLDPTLLLTLAQWREASSRPQYPVPERYVLCYFLGKITPEYQQAILSMAGGLPVINVCDPGDLTHYVTHPGEFVYMIDHADFVCTDSFHGTAFSVNLHKNFLAFSRRQKGMENMFGRIESILSNTGLMNHVYEHGMTSRPDVPDYDSVDGKLDALREKSLTYLRECLKL